MVSWFQKLKEEADKIQEEYGYCILDGHREKIGNFKTEPPGLFRGRGEHPKMGMLKKRVMPEDVVINCSRWVCPWKCLSSWGFPWDWGQLGTSSAQSWGFSIF